jgi:hypothetical protein
VKVAELITMVGNIMPNDIDENDFVRWVNVIEDTIYQKFIKDMPKPTLKTLQTISSDELSLLQYGYRWVTIYEYYIYGQISLSYQEFGKANNYFMLYNSMIDEFVQQYFPILDNTIRTDRLKNYR